MIAVVQHFPDHDVVAHRIDATERHACAGFLGDYLVPKLVAGWAAATDAELAYEVRRLHAQPASELTTLLLNLVTDEQARRALAACPIHPQPMDSCTLCSRSAGRGEVGRG